MRSAARARPGPRRGPRRGRAGHGNPGHEIRAGIGQEAQPDVAAQRVGEREGAALDEHRRRHVPVREAATTGLAPRAATTARMVAGSMVGWSPGGSRRRRSAPAARRGPAAGNGSSPVPGTGCGPSAGRRRRGGPAQPDGHHGHHRPQARGPGKLQHVLEQGPALRSAQLLCDAESSGLARRRGSRRTGIDGSDDIGPYTGPNAHGAWPRDRGRHLRRDPEGRAALPRGGNHPARPRSWSWRERTGERCPRTTPGALSLHAPSTRSSPSSGSCRSSSPIRTTGHARPTNP